MAHGFQACAGRHAVEHLHIDGGLGLVCSREAQASQARTKPWFYGTYPAARIISRTGRPVTALRLIGGLLYLQHAFDLSDEEVL